MTKEEFISTILDMRIYGGDSIVAKQFLDEFFESNVCIPKVKTSAYDGENKRDMLEPIDAVVHMLKGGECTHLKGGTVLWNGERFKYKHQDNGFSLNASFKYLRIKPAEPVWEYQFVYIKADNTAELTQFYTDEEAKDCHQWIKLEETKRERK